MTIRKKKNPKAAAGIDLGNGYAAIGVFEGGKYMPIESPIDGAQVATIAFVNPESGNWHFDGDAILHGYNDTGDNFISQAKRNLYESPRDKIYCDGRFSALDFLAKFQAYMLALLLGARPDLAEYPQFGGNKRPADDLAVVFSTPANWTLEQHTAYTEAITAAGFKEFDGFIAEPVAAARRVTHMNNVALNNGDKILVVDVGAGTTDIAVLEYLREVFHQIAAASGDAYMAGHDFTNAIAAAVAKKFRVSWKNVYGRGGLNLSRVSPRQRPLVMACWQAAEETKKKLSVLEEVTVAVDFAKGRKTYPINRQQAAQLWGPLMAKFKECVAKSLDNTQLGFSDIDRPIVAGGSSRVPGVPEAMAEVMDRPVTDILVCTDSEHIVSAGTSEHAFFQDQASQVLEPGLGFVVFDQTTGDHRNKLMIPPGQVVSHDGHYMEQSGFQISTSTDRRSLVCRPFICKTGVRATVVTGRETFLEDTEILPLETVQTALDGFPEGDHAIAVGVKVDPNRNLRMLVRATGLAHVEPLSIPLVMNPQATAPESQTAPKQILLVLDCSESMSGKKLKMLQRGAKKFLTYALSHGAQVGIVVFPDLLTLGGAKLLCPRSTDEQSLAGAVDSLTADGGTPMSDGLRLADETLAQVPQGTQRIAVMFTDGMPNDSEQAVIQAEALKHHSRLIAVGIGDDALTPWLTALATSPTDYFYAECAENILVAFSNVVELVWAGQALAIRDESRKSPSADSAAPPAVGDDYDQDWDQMDSDDKEVA